MKKLLALVAIVGFVACNSAETTAPAADTTMAPVVADTTMAPVAADTTMAPAAAPASH